MKKVALGSEGHKKHHNNLIDRLKNKDIATLADHLDLPITDAEEAELLFLGTMYLISNKGVKRSDRKKVPIATGSALIHYLLKSSSSQPAGKFVTLDELAGPLFNKSSFSRSALENPIVKRFQGRLPELLSIAAAIGGRKGGTSGLGSVSLIFDLLPNILLQLIFYDQDDEFPARSTLLIDANAIEFIDFEALAFLISTFVQFLTRSEPCQKNEDRSKPFFSDYIFPLHLTIWIFMRSLNWLKRYTCGLAELWHSATEHSGNLPSSFFKKEAKNHGNIGFNKISLDRRA